MSTPAPTVAQPDEADGPDGWERALLDRQLEALGRLADMGMAIAAAIEQRVTAPDPGAAPDPVLRHAALDFPSVARAVRMAFALQSRLIADFNGKARPQAGEPAGETYEVAWDEPPGEDQRRRVRRMVRRAAEASDLDHEAVQRLLCEAAERLEDDDAYGDIMTRPVGEVVARICADLGLAAEWTRLAEDAQVQAEMVAEATGLPFADWWPRRMLAPAPSAPRPSG